ncbi:MAG: outer membrane lipid asymmetry maintenance protein MlaD [Micavibrio aeruginosavorus]|nr:outer membrane lipid asymmetry maintenance protein MlaD [Micavibrio aeruginosavorus]
MKRSVIETVLGAVVLFVSAFFLIFSYKTANVSSVSGYDLVADFSGIGGLKAGDDVQISGVKVGSVSRVDLNPENYLARVTITVEPQIRVPDDTAALISSESLLGGRFLALEPGGSEEMLGPGGRIPFTQSPQNLEQLLGQFIFSMKDSKPGESGGGNSAPIPQ